VISDADLKPVGDLTGFEAFINHLHVDDSLHIAAEHAKMP